MTVVRSNGEVRVGAMEACRAFVDAVAWGEHHRVWGLLALEGRKTVLRVAISRGMDEALAMRLREGTATDSELDEFLTDLVRGLRADLEGTDLDSLEYVLDPEPPGPGRARVVLFAPVPEPLAAGGALPAGWVELERDEAGAWLVERLVPRPKPGS